MPRPAAIVAGLSRLLADSNAQYLTTGDFHWNVTGPIFTTLHDASAARAALRNVN